MTGGDMNLDTFLQKLNDTPELIEFEETMAAIEDHYAFTPTAFRNGALSNEAGQNSGSCKLFAFAQLQGLSPQQTLACFGHYYREDVLPHPAGSDHQNIRNFMHSGWQGISFEGRPLTRKPL
jgi:hypothetical protein